MLCLTAAWSLAFLAPLYVFSLFPSPKESLLARRLPKPRPTLRVWAMLVAVLAVDFAMIRLCCSIPVPLCLYVSDVAVVMVPLLASMYDHRTVGELWGLAFGVGLVGLSLMPAVVMR